MANRVFLHPCGSLLNFHHEDADLTQSCKLILDMRRLQVPVQSRAEPVDDVSMLLFELSEPGVRFPMESISSHR